MASGDREIKIVISAQDDYTAAMNKFKAAMGDSSSTADSAASKVSSSWKNTINELNSLNGKYLEMAKMVGSAWLGVTGLMSSIDWLKEAKDNAIANEEAYRKLNFQVESMGLSYQKEAGHIEEAINKASEYAHIQDDDVAKTLQTLVFNSGKYQESLDNLNLTYDLAYQKGISVEESASLIGKAMTGNVEMLGRYIPELKNLDDTLGKNATAQEKSNYALLVLKEKSEGAMSAMTEYEKATRETTKQMQDFQEAVGRVIIAVKMDLTAGFYSAAAAVLYLDGYFAQMMSKLAGLTSKEWGKEWADHGAAALAAADELGTKADRLTTSASNLVFQTERQAVSLNKAGNEAKNYAKDVKAANDAALAAANNAEVFAVFYKAYMESIQDEEKIWTDWDKKLQKNRDNRFAKETKDYEEQQKKIEEIKLTALQKLAELEQNNPYEYSGGGLKDAAALSDIANTQLTYETKLYMLQEYNTKVLQAMVDAGDSQALVQARYKDLSISYTQKEYQTKLTAYATLASQLSALSGEAYSTLGEKQKEFFYLQKALAFVSTIINTEVAATAAMAPPPIGAGPVFGIPLSTWIRGVGYASAALIAASTFTSTSAGSSSGSTSIDTGSLSSTSTTDTAIPSSLSTTDSTKQTQSITINIQNGMGDAAYWKQITEDNIIPAINDASSRNIDITVVSR